MIVAPWKVVGVASLVLLLAACVPSNWNSDKWDAALGQQRSLADINAAFCGNASSRPCSLLERLSLKSHGQLGDEGALSRLRRSAQRSLALCLTNCGDYTTISVIVKMDADPDLKREVTARTLARLKALGAKTEVGDDTCAKGCMYVALAPFIDLTAPELDREVSVAPTGFNFGIVPGFAHDAEINLREILKVSLGSSWGTTAFAWRTPKVVGAICVISPTQSRSDFFQALDVCVLGTSVAPCSIECLSLSRDLEARAYVARKYNFVSGEGSAWER